MLAALQQHPVQSTNEPLGFLPKPELFPACRELMHANSHALRVGLSWGTNCFCFTHDVRGIAAADLPAAAMMLTHPVA